MALARMALPIAVCSLAACSIADFDVDQAIQPQTIPGSSIPAELTPLFPLPLSLDLSSKIQARNTGPIDAVTLASLTLQITSSGGDWSFVHSIDVFVESTKSGTTLAKVKIAAIGAPGTVRTMDFTVVPGVNLKPYVEEGSQVDTTATGSRPSSDITFDGTSVFTVHPL